MNELHSFVLVLVIAAVTIGLRFLPFVVFSHGAPRTVVYLSTTLPYAIMGMLCVYCLKNIDFSVMPFGLSEIVAVIIVILLHKWRHSTLLSILGGTAVYMLFVQILFP